MISQEYLKSISGRVKEAYTVSDGVLDTGAVGALGLGGLSTSASLSHLVKQLKFIAKYNPEILGGAGSKSLAKALKSLRAGDVLVYGDSVAGGPSLINKLPGYYTGSGGMGGFDEHAVYLQQLDDRYGKGGARGLRAVTPTEQTDTRSMKVLREIFDDPTYRPKTYSPRVKALESAIKQSLLKALGLADHGRGGPLRGGEFRNYVDAIRSLPASYVKQHEKLQKQKPDFRTGHISKREHQRILRHPELASTASEYFTPYDASEAAPFSVLRAKDKDLDLSSKRLRNIAKDTISEGDMAVASLRRRFLPSWLTEATDRARSYINPRRSNQAPTCAGGSCYVATGKGRTLLPSDLRYNKDFSVAKDYLPRAYLKARTGERSVAKGMEKLKHSMRGGAFRSSVPGLLVGGALTGLGAAPLLRHAVGGAKQAPKFDLNKFVTESLSKSK